jgi:hypothetical protein
MGGSSSQLLPPTAQRNCIGMVSGYVDHAEVTEGTKGPHFGAQSVNPYLLLSSSNLLSSQHLSLALFSPLSMDASGSADLPLGYSLSLGQGNTVPLVI